ncbi:MAG: amidohydrolase family protein, partial [Anaerolineaceae bacterium]|nr:amidohydrolase family protein [Anaerolineaceae bacterium]
MQNNVLFKNARIFTPVDVWEPGWILFEGETITRMGPGKPPEFEPGNVLRVVDAMGQTILPGFIDLHVHGASGQEVMDANPEGLREMARFFARHGVTGWLATTWTDTPVAIQKALKAIAEVAGPVRMGATILG